MRQAIFAKAVLLDEQDRVLMLRRSSTDTHKAGKQDFPGGGIEEGEGISEGMAREIMEEAGIVIPISELHLFYSATEAYQDRSVTRLVFWARVTSPTVTLSFEHDEYHWVNAALASQEFPHPVYGIAVDYGIKNHLFD